MSECINNLENHKSRYERDTTKRLSFRNNDLLIHLRFETVFDTTPSLIDIWQLTNGQFATITNRVEDLPDWFQLHPSEACNSLAYKMLDQFNKADYPSQPIEGPNIWRARKGDSIVWLGDSRSDIESYQGILKIFTFSECALVIGEPFSNDFEKFLSFGD